MFYKDLEKVQGLSILAIIKQLYFKMESHNSPSAIEPFIGAATGAGGVLRDVFSMGARPVALVNSLRFGDLNGCA